MDVVPIKDTATGPSNADGGHNPYGGCNGIYQTTPGAPVPNLGPSTVAAIWVLLGLSTVFLIARLTIKQTRSRSLWWDDWVLIISWICFVVDATMSQTVVNLGFGKYPCDIDPRNFATIGLMGNIGTTYGVLGVVWSKTSFALTLLRITDGKTKALVWFIIVSMNIAMGLLALFTWIQCNPISKTWDHSVQGTCWSSAVSNGYGVFSGVYSGVMDITLALLPWKVIWNLQMKKKEKLGVAVGMSMGLFAGATAFIKSSKILTLGSDNFTYDGTQLLLWAAAEIGTTIMAACIPVLRALVREVHMRSNDGRPRRFSTWSSAPSFWKKWTHSESTTSGSRISRTTTAVGSTKNFSYKSPVISAVDANEGRFERLDSHESDSEKILLPLQGVMLRGLDIEEGGGHTTMQMQNLAPGERDRRSNFGPHRGERRGTAY